MNIEVFMWAVGVILTVAVPLTGWIVTMIFAKLEKHSDKHDDLETRFEAHRLYAAETFPTKTDVEKGFDRLVEYLDKIDQKLDRKVDKG